jgi:hypothetical protein
VLDSVIQQDTMPIDQRRRNYRLRFSHGNSASLLLDSLPLVKLTVGSAIVNHISPKIININQNFVDHLLDKASIIENAKIRVCLHVYSDSDLSNSRNLKHLVYSVDYSLI